MFTLQRQYVSVTSWQVVLVAGVMVRLKASHPLWRSEFKSHWSQFTVFQQNGHIIAIQYKIRTSVAYIGILVISFMGRYCDTCGEQFKLDYRQFSEQFHCWFCKSQLFEPRNQSVTILLTQIRLLKLQLKSAKIS